MPMDEVTQLDDNISDISEGTAKETVDKKSYTIYREGSVTNIEAKESLSPKFVLGKDYKYRRSSLQIDRTAFNGGVAVKPISKSKHIIYPDDKKKIAWDCLVGMLILYSVAVIPFRIGFAVEPGMGGVVFDYVVDIMFAIDMGVSFFTAYEADGKYVVSLRLIAWKYCCGWFVPDAVSTFPFDSVVPLLVSNVSSGSLRSLKLVRALRLFRLLKIFRVARLNRKMKQAKVTDHVHPIVFDLLSLFSRIILLAHLMACCFYYVSLCATEERDWTLCGDDNLYSKYLLSLYWTLATMLGVGYGDVVLSTSDGRLFSILVMFLGSLTFGFIVATVSESVQNWDPRDSLKKLKMDEVREYMSDKNLPKEMKTQVWKHFEYYYNKLSTFPEETILNSMPVMLQQLVLEKTRGGLTSLKLFRSEDYGSLSQVLPHLKPMYATPREVIVYEGDYCVDMFFVVSGCIHAYKQNQMTDNRQILVGLYTNGSDFGMGHALRGVDYCWATYRAVALSDLMWLSFEHVQRIAKISEKMATVFDMRAQHESESFKEVSQYFSHVETVSDIRVPSFLIHDGDVISSRHIAKYLSESIKEEGSAKVYRTVILAGKTDKGKDIYKDAQETTADMWKRWIINPHSAYKIYFDMFVGIFILFSAISIPYRLGLNIETDATWSAIDAVNEIVFGIDIVLCFFTAYEQSDYALHTVLKNIARRYIKTWFLIDVLSTVPFYRLSENSSGAVSHALEAAQLARLMRMLRMLKLARVMKIVRMFKKEKSSFNNDMIAIEDAFSRIGKLILFLAFVTHLTACFWCWVAQANDNNSWADAEGVDIADNQKYKKYIASVYWTYATMATVGYGDIVAANDSERLYTIFVMMMGSTILAYIVGTVSSQAFGNEGSNSQEKKLSVVRDYLAEQGIPKSLRFAIMKHFCFNMEQRTAQEETRLWSMMPHQLRHKVAMAGHMQTIERLPLFSRVKDTVMTVLLTQLEPCLAVAGSYVYNFETGSGGIYFILRGTAVLVDEDDCGDEIIATEIKAGMFFGHERFVGKSIDFVGIRAHTELCMLCLSDKRLSHMKKEMPLAYAILTKLINDAMAVAQRVPNNTISSKPQKRKLLEKANSSVEQFFEWIASDMDESCWVQESTFTKAKSLKKMKSPELGALQRPSATLSTRSQDRFAMMKKASQSSLLSGHNNSTHNVYSDPSSELSEKSGRRSYAEMYGTIASNRSVLSMRAALSVKEAPGNEEDDGEQSSVRPKRNVECKDADSLSTQRRPFSDNNKVHPIDSVMSLETTEDDVHEISDPHSSDLFR